jgi:pimeloyl-ACP methyl ester carboxylesterase
MESAMVDIPEPTASEASPRPGVLCIGRGRDVAVLLHASLGSKRQWVPLARRIESSLRSVAVDLWGYGDAPMPSREPHTLDHEVDRVHAQLVALFGFLPRVHLVGHSYGGAVALRFAQRHPARTASLALFEPVSFSLLQADSPERWAIAAVREAMDIRFGWGDARGATSIFVDFWSGEGAFAALSPATQSALEARIAKVPLDFAAAAGAPVTAADLAQLRVPALLLGGTRSPAVTQSILTKLTRSLPAVRTGWLDTGHMGPVDAHPRVDPLLAAWLELARERAAAAPAIAPAAQLGEHGAFLSGHLPWTIERSAAAASTSLPYASAR